jgi:hypothetical protein
MFELECAHGGADVVVGGDERHVEKELRRFADAGATEFIAVPFGSPEQVVGLEGQHDRRKLSELDDTLQLGA